ncbi:hypothetical protein DM01DRAFT_1321992 [Hesseltinella vesiculosa]|uniref:Globin domain-containing protein n=1 Tax=Hesseltinella vesiculosa TaxID=101127 RepID=A0A1X2GJW1_9FUNG|nr:hypothetical protein DM01DRAFT_1321992 [Hesseltinella vesiculosa]
MSAYDPLSEKGKAMPPPMPDGHDIDLVRTSWQDVLDQPRESETVSSAQVFGLAFYDALFKLNPAARTLFGTDVVRQSKMLTYVIAYIARAPIIVPPTQPPTNLQDNEATPDLDSSWLIDSLRELGQRHYFYNVHPQDLLDVWPSIDAALKATLKDKYTPVIAGAWRKTVDHVTYHLTFGINTQRKISENKRRRTISCCTQ